MGRTQRHAELLSAIANKETQLNETRQGKPSIVLSLRDVPP